MADDRLLTVPEVAEFFRTTPDAVRRWIRQGKLKAHMPGGQKTGYRIRQTELARFLGESATSGEIKAAA